MKARLFAVGLALCALVVSMGTIGCHKQSQSSAPDLSVSGGVSSGLDFVQGLFNGTMKTATSGEGEDTDLKAALLTQADLPPGYASPMGDMRMTGETPAGPMRGIARQFAQQDPANPARSSGVMAMAFSGLSGMNNLNSEDDKKRADKSGLYKSTEALDTSGIGESSSGLRTVSDLGVSEQIMWVRGDTTYMLFLMNPEGWPNPLDGVALSRIMDDRASGKAPIPSPNPTPAAPAAIPGVGGPSALFGGATPKMDSDPPPADLTVLLLTDEDLPSGFEAIVKDMHLTADAATGPADVACSIFMKQGESGVEGSIMLMVYAYASPPSNSPASCEAMQNYATQTGAYQAVEGLDTSGLGDESCGVRTLSDEGIMDTYVWSRGSRYYMLMLDELKSTTQSVDGLALAKIMDSRAQAASN